MKIVIWMNMPSHHQDDFFLELERNGVKLLVVYYEKLSEERKILGWKEGMIDGVRRLSVEPDVSSILKIPDWRDCIHIIPGCGTSFLRNISTYLCREGVAWIHWSEASNPGLRRMLGLPLKMWYASLVNRFGLGALSISLLAEKDFLRWGIKKEKIFHLPYSISDLKRRVADQAIASFKGEKKLFLYVGSLSFNKGLAELLDAFKVISHRSDHWRLALIGNDDSKGKLKQRAEDNGIADKVLFRGTISSHDIATAYTCADVFVLPSRYDGWGMVVNEAISMSLPVVSTSSAGASWHLIDHGVNGFRIPARNVSSLIRAMSLYVENPSLIDCHGSASKLIFKNNSSQIMASRFIQIVKSMQCARF